MGETWKHSLGGHYVKIKFFGVAIVKYYMSHNICGGFTNFGGLGPYPYLVLYMRGEGYKIKMKMESSIQFYGTRDYLINGRNIAIIVVVEMVKLTKV